MHQTDWLSLRSILQEMRPQHRAANFAEAMARTGCGDHRMDISPIFLPEKRCSNYSFFAVLQVQDAPIAFKLFSQGATLFLLITEVLSKKARFHGEFPSKQKILTKNSTSVAEKI